MSIPETHSSNPALTRKILGTLIVFPIFVLIPLTFIMMIAWDYLALSDQYIFNWERVLHIVTIRKTIPFTSISVTPMILLLFTDLLSFVLYLWHLSPIFHYIKTGEDPEKVEVRIFTGFNLLFWPGFLILSFLYGTFFIGEEAIPADGAVLYRTINVLFLGLNWATFVLACMLVVRITAIPVTKMINRVRISHTETFFLDRVLPFLPSIFFTVGLFLIYFRSMHFLFFYGGQITNPAIPRMTTQYPVFAFLLGMFLILIIGLSYLISASETQERLPIKVELENLAEGHADLTQRLVVPSRNQRGVFVSHFNDFLEKFQRLVLRLKSYVSEIGQGVNTLKKNFQQIAHSEEAQQKEIAPLSSSVESISQGMEQLIGHVKEKYDYIENNLRHINDVTQGIESIIVLFQGIKKQSFNSLSTANIVMKQIKESMEKSNQMMESMTTISTKIQAAGQEAEHIDEILTLIQDISEQTNILSINAAIEAAHAGDDGKGFAIVANEVRTLATESGKAVEHISQKLLDIQQLIRSSVEMTLVAETITQENSVLVTESYGIINKMIEQFKKTGRITENTATIIAQQGGITRSFHKQIRSLMIFFENLRNTMGSQEASFEELRGTLEALQESFSTVSDYNNIVRQSVDGVAKTEKTLNGMVGIFKTE